MINDDGRVFKFRDRRILTAPLVGGNCEAKPYSHSFTVLDPCTEEEITRVLETSETQIDGALDAAESSAVSWRRAAPRKRAEILRRCHDLMIASSEWLAALISLENGKALRDSRSEVAYAAEYFRWFSEEAVRAEGSFGVAPSGSNRILVQHEPIGLSILVTPWNFPAAMATRKLAPALAAGCTCILKPAAETPLTALALAELMQKAGVPDGVVSILPTTDPDPLVTKLLKDPRTRKLSFTGSTAVGRKLLEKAARQVINCSMELGGNAPFIVLEDADIEAAVQGAMVAKMRNGGQACTAANRFYVHTRVYDSFVELFAKQMAQVRLGPSLAEDTQCGPLVSKTARAKVKSLVDDAVHKGATLVIGGTEDFDKGYFFAPTVLAAVPRDADILTCEIFGPVAPIVPIEDEDEAISAANSVEYGLVS